MTDKHKRHAPTTTRVSNDFATKREVMVAVKNLTRETEMRLAEVEALLLHLMTPWYVRLWRKVAQ